MDGIKNQSAPTTSTVTVAAGFNPAAFSYIAIGHIHRPLWYIMIVHLLDQHHQQDHNHELLPVARRRQLRERE